MEEIIRSSGINQIGHLVLRRHQQEQQSGEVADNQSQTSQQEGTLDDPAELTPKEKKKVTELQGRDREVRNHEHAHKTAAGRYATGGPKFDFQRGPDGRLYAVGGEVGIDTSRVSDDPGATIRKAQIIRKAALAPRDPSAKDRQIAAEANRMEREARAELREEQQEETEAIQDGDLKSQTPYEVDAESDNIDGQPISINLFA